MKRTLGVICAVFLAGTASGQYPGLTLPPSGNVQKAAVTQYIGAVRVAIEYSSPSVHIQGQNPGQGVVDRRGKIWGQLVPYGMTDLGFGHRKPAPWRAGANENTVFEVSDAVLIEGKPLPAGRYGLHMIVEPEEWTLILSKNSTAWGSFFYEPGEDALRVKLKPRKHEYREWLTYEFTSRKPDEATAELQWEDLAVGWTVKVPSPNEIYVSRLRQELKNVPGFNWQGWVTAAQFCVQENTNLEEALRWADYAISGQFIGQKNFATLSTKSQVLSKLGRQAESAALMKEAIEDPSATPPQIHQYGRQLLAAKKNKEALEVFEFNAKRNGDTWPVHVGLARGYAAVGETAKALEHAKKAAAQAPDDLNRKNLENMVKQFEAELKR
jgi:hypothetical protein